MGSVENDNDALYNSSGEDSQLHVDNPDAGQLQVWESIEGTLPPAVEAFLNVLTRGYLSFSFISSHSLNNVCAMGLFFSLGDFRVHAPKILLWVAYLEILLNDSFSYVF